MAHIKIPVEFALQLVLSRQIIDENNKLGADSPLLAFLAEKEIDLAADGLAGDDAEAQETIRATQDAASIAANKNRDNNIKPVIKFIRAAAQVLKKFYSSNYATLLDWAIPITDSGRIDYPSSFEEMNQLATSFFKKLATFPAGKSPLDVYIKTNNIDVADLTAKNVAAAKNNTDAIAAAKAAENATEQRNLLWKNPLAHIRLIGDFLKALYPNNPRALGVWGFVVDESGKTPKLRKSRLKLGETKIVTGVAIGSILTNSGKGNIIVYKGKGIAGASTIVTPGSKMGILSGYSVITVVNPSTLENGEFTVETDK